MALTAQQLIEKLQKGDVNKVVMYDYMEYASPEDSVGQRVFHSADDVQERQNCIVIQGSFEGSCYPYEMTAAYMVPMAKKENNG